MRIRYVVSTLCVAVLCGPAVAGAQTAASGGLALVPGAQSCVQAPGTLTDDGAPATTCQTLAPLVGAGPTAVSADGRFVYVAGGTDAFTIYGHGNGYGGLLVLSRDAASGALARVQCLSGDTSDGNGTLSCDPVTAMAAPSDIAISADGAAVAVVASGSGSLTLFSRDADTGKLTELGCAQENVPYKGHCLGAPSLEGVTSVIFSPDGKDLYAASPARSAIVQLRQEDDGTLTRRCFSADASAGSCERLPQVLAPSQLKVTADGATIYAATDAGLMSLTRDPATGRLSSGGCIVPATGAACPAGRSLPAGTAYPSTLAIAPDGNTLLVSSAYDYEQPLIVLRRGADGALQRTGCVAEQPVQDDEGDDDSGDDDSGDDDSGDDASARADTAPACTLVPVLPYTAHLVALADGRFLNAGYGASTVLSVDAQGVPHGDGCLAPADDRCAPLALANGWLGGAALPGGGALLAGTNIAQLAPAPMATARATRAGVAVRVRCPATAGTCAGSGSVVALGANVHAPLVLRSGARPTFSVAGGASGAVALALPRGTRRATAALTVRAAGRTLRVLAPVAGLRGLSAPIAPRACTGQSTLAAHVSAKILARRGGVTIGCLAGSPPVRLDVLGARVSGPVALAGRFAAVTLRAAAGPGRTYTSVAVVDLRRGRVVHVSPAAVNALGAAVATLVLKPDGAVAWTSCASASGRCTGGRGDELHVQDVRGARTAVTASHRITALRLNGSALRFQVAGTPRALTLA